MTDGQKKLFGCENETNYTWEAGDYKLNRCPISSITDVRIFNYIRAYNRYKNGFGPDDGGWLNWPHKFNMVIDIIEYEIARVEKLKQKARDKK